MFHLVLIFTIAIEGGLGAGSTVSGAENRQTVVLAPAAQSDAPTAAPQGTNPGGASLLDGTSKGDTAAATDGWQPEDQTPTGKFTTATEVKPILTATKSQWVAVREYEGKDYLYFTNLLAWRCGLHQVSYGMNGAPEQVLEIEACHIDTAQPNALTMEEHNPFVILDAGTVNSLTVTLVYDDGTTDTATYQRSDILMP